MNLPFYKMHGTGNDFILFDRMSNDIPELDSNWLQYICHRRFGIGADGVIIIDSSVEQDFKMIYFNSDGDISSMCGNGGRCIVALAHSLGYIKQDCRFEAIDGIHSAHIDNSMVSLVMNDVQEVQKLEDKFILNTGSPHYIQFYEDIDDKDMITLGRKIRYNDQFKEKGINVNIVERNLNDLKVRTYERGVEDETYSCGTGVTAAAIAAHLLDDNFNQFNIQTKGGELEVSFDVSKGKFTNIRLNGPTKLICTGVVEYTP